MEMRKGDFQILLGRLEIGENIVHALKSMGYWILDVSEYLYWREGEIMKAQKRYIKSLGRKNID